jgi:hypothetical protein
VKATIFVVWIRSRSEARGSKEWLAPELAGYPRYDRALNDFTESVDANTTSRLVNPNEARSLSVDRRTRQMGEGRARTAVAVFSKNGVAYRMIALEEIEIEIEDPEI